MCSDNEVLNDLDRLDEHDLGWAEGCLQGQEFFWNSLLGGLGYRQMKVFDDNGKGRDFYKSKNKSKIFYRFERGAPPGFGEDLEYPYLGVYEMVDGNMEFRKGIDKGAFDLKVERKLRKFRIQRSL